MCIWWDWKGALYYELLLENLTINSSQAGQTTARPCRKSSGKPWSCLGLGVSTPDLSFQKMPVAAAWRKSCVETNVEAPAEVQERHAQAQTPVVASEMEGTAGLELYLLRSNNWALMLNCIWKVRVKQDSGVA